ncbi:MAG: hypothetical protein ACRDNB_11420 [Gaiellaceae bacterium]
MHIDGHPLTRLRRYEDPEAGIFEEFAVERLGADRALALLAGPLEERRTTAWVICPAIGPAHGNLRRLEALVARTLAAAGFVSLRIRPDADPVQREIDLSKRLAEIEAGIELARAETGVENVGLAGALFGGTLAALTADRLGLPALALVQPASRGRQFARGLLRREAVAQLMGADEEAAAAEGPMHELSTSGIVSIRGLTLTQEAFDAISTVKLVEDMRAFRGRSLLVDVSPGGVVSTSVAKLAERLAELGGETTMETIADPLYAPLGEYYYRDAGLLRIDTRLELDQKVAHKVSAWALQGAEAPSATPVA